MLFPARWPAISFQSSLSEQFPTSLQMQRGFEANRCECSTLSEAAKTFSKTHSYRYRNCIFPSGFAAGHGYKSPLATDTHLFHLPFCIWMALNSHMAI